MMTEFNPQNPVQTGDRNSNPGIKTSESVKIVGLRTSLLDRPLGLEDRQPTFSWRIEADRPDVVQCAYRILVASSAAALADENGDLWDSGRVATANSVGIRYAGVNLSSRQRCYWSVRIWDDAGHDIRAAETSWWEMGLLDRSDWIGQWLAAESEDEREDRLAGMVWQFAPMPAGDQARAFRWSIEVEERCEALLTVAAQGRIQHLTIDNRPLGLPSDHSALLPAPTVQTRMELAAGAHVLGLEVARLIQLPTLDDRTQTQLAPELAVAAQLKLIYANRVERFTGDWYTNVAPKDDWRLSSSSNSGWRKAEPILLQPDAPWAPAPARLMRRSFALAEPIRSARLYVTALGSYRIYLNGRRVGQDELAPEMTDFRRRALYRVHDVTNLIANGGNVIAAIVGDGWYASYYAGRRYDYGPAPRRLRAQLEIELSDGKRVTIASDGHWRTAASPIISSEIYEGEIYDARFERDGWNEPGFDDANWDRVSEADAPAMDLVALTSPPIRANRILDPMTIKEIAPGCHVLDFGQNMAGWARIKVRTVAGTRITLRFAESLGSDGQVDQGNLRGARAADVYIARGKEEGEIFEPHFTYHGFRYIQLDGLLGPLPKDLVSAVAIYTDMAESGCFRSGSPSVTRTWLNTLWSQRSNFVGVPTDCPQRAERFGWTGDAYSFWGAAAFNMDVASFTRRFMNDLRDGQGKDGSFGIWAPFGTIAKHLTGDGATPAWADAGVLLPYVAFMRYGDRTIVDENWDAMSRYVDGVLRDNPGYLWRRRRGADFGDWFSLDAKNLWEETTPRELVATAVLCRSCDHLAELAAATGRTEAAALYRAHAGMVREAFLAEYVRTDGLVGNGSQTGYILALSLKLLSPDLYRAAATRLAADIRNRGNVLSCGFVGTPLSLDAIADSGDGALVYDLLLRTEYPSWGFMVERGATTIWEGWKSGAGDVVTESLNHYALGAVCDFLYRRIAGIDPLEPGFARFRVNPIIDRRIGGAGACYDSVRGRISTDWRLVGEDYMLSIAVPPNSRAEVILPVARESEITEGSSPISERTDIRPIAMSSQGTVLEVGSGQYNFRCRFLGDRTGFNYLTGNGTMKESAVNSDRSRN